MDRPHAFFLGKTRICIYQIDCVGQDLSMVVTPISVIRDYPRWGIRSWVALSENFFLQCFTLRDKNGEKIGPGSTIVLQLRRYSQVLPHYATQFVEERVESNGPVSGKNKHAGYCHLMYPCRPMFSFSLVTGRGSRRQLSLTYTLSAATKTPHLRNWHCSITYPFLRQQIFSLDHSSALNAPILLVPMRPPSGGSPSATNTIRHPSYKNLGIWNLCLSKCQVLPDLDHRHPSSLGRGPPLKSSCTSIATVGSASNGSITMPQTIARFG